MDPLAAATLALVAVTLLPYLAFVALYAWFRPAGSPAAKRLTEPTASVLLPSYNEERIVRRKLAEICSLDYPMDRVEVVVVDSSDDRTPEIVREFFLNREHPSLVLVHEDDRRGVAPALNDAMGRVSGEIVLRTDCDSALSPNALREAASNLADPTVDGVTGRQIEVLGGSAVEADYRGMLSRIQALESHLDSTFIVHGPCFAFRRRAFSPIDPSSLADDTEIAVRIRRAGGRVVMDPVMGFAESGASGFRERRLRKDRRAMGLVRLLVQHRDALGRYGRYGRVVLPFNWWFMVVSPWLALLCILAGSAAAVSLVGAVGLTVPAGLLAFVWLGGRDRLGPLQPPYAVVDSQVSLLVAMVRLLRGTGDGTWAVDRESREAFE